MRDSELGVTIDHYLGSLGIHHYAAGPGVHFTSVAEQHGNASLLAEMRGGPSFPQLHHFASEGAGTGSHYGKEQTRLGVFRATLPVLSRGSW